MVERSSDSSIPYRALVAAVIEQAVQHARGNVTIRHNAPHKQRELVLEAKRFLVDGRLEVWLSFLDDLDEGIAAQIRREVLG